VDGDPDSGEVWRLLNSYDDLSIVYIPSNHANISYQRYLGWRAARNEQSSIILYLDDDLRINQANSIELLITPLKEQNNRIIGSTAPIIFPDAPPDKLRDSKIKGLTRRLSRLFYSRISLSEDDIISITPIGSRKGFITGISNSYPHLNWAYGGVMAYKMHALNESCFLKDSFALHEIGCGIGEDTLISHIASYKGDIILVREAKFTHPNADQTRAYPRDPYRYGYAYAYSRRLINDHFRYPPSIGDRLFLITSYLTGNLSNFVDMITLRNDYTTRYAKGYFRGSIRGLFQRPKANKLTPEINWEKDAETAISNGLKLNDANNR